MRISCNCKNFYFPFSITYIHTHKPKGERTINLFLYKFINIQEVIISAKQEENAMKKEWSENKSMFMEIKIMTKFKMMTKIKNENCSAGL